MIINVFGKWINPNRISYLKDLTNYSNGQYNNNVRIAITAIMYDGCYVEIHHKTELEVATEINKQLEASISSKEEM